MWYDTKRELCAMHTHLHARDIERIRKKIALQVCRICLKSGKLFNCCVLACEAQCVAIKQRKNCDTCKDRRQNKAFWIEWIFYAMKKKKKQEMEWTPTHQKMIIKYEKKNPFGVNGKHTKETSAREKKRKELFMVCILHNINYAIKLPSTPFVTGQIVWRR